MVTVNCRLSLLFCVVSVTNNRLPNDDETTKVIHSYRKFRVSVQIDKLFLVQQDYGKIVGQDKIGQIWQQSLIQIK